MTRLEYVQSGQRRRRSANDHNDFTEAARRVRELGESGGRAKFHRDQNITVLIRNEAEESVAAGEVLEITGVLIDAEDNKNLFQFGGTPILKGSLPTGDVVDAWVVTAEPAETQKIARAYLWGVFPGLVVEGSDPLNRYCNPRSGEKQLYGFTGGECKILYASSEDPALCLLQKLPQELRYLGRASEAISRGSTGTVRRYSRYGYNSPSTPLKGAEIDTLEDYECYARHGDVADEDWVQFHFFDGGWEIYQADC